MPERFNSIVTIFRSKAIPGVFFARAKIMRVLTLCVAMLWFSGCDQIYYLLQKEGAEEKKLVGDTEAIEYNENVGEAQKMLSLLGYSVGRVDGKFGPKTRDAIAEFQEDNGIKVSRFLDNETWARLHAFEQTGLVVGGNINYGAVQAALKSAGHNPGALDGKMGPQTKRALLAFQSANGLKPDGVIGRNTLLKLSQFLQPSPRVNP